MNGPGDLAKGWLQKADSDLATAQLVLSSDGPYDTACYHAQQAIEKCLKAILAYNGVSIPRTHNLEELGQSAVDAVPSLELDIDGLAEITPFAVEPRYDPDFWPDRDTAADALATARLVRSRAASVLPAAARP
jgi:HEPN domain-containing protein